MSGAAEAPATAAAPPPRANPDLVGHERAEHELRRLYDSGRLPHAILLCGPRGIGKATLAYRLARLVLAQPVGAATGEAAGPFGAAPADLWLDPQSGVFRRVAAGSHADLLTIERAYDPRRRRLRSEIVVEEVRQVGAFLRLTAAEGGWRVVVVDGAEEMNRNAANALLKILEEPPRRALLLLVSHAPGLLLPTVRSRCRRLPLAPLAPASMRALFARYRPQLGEAEAEALAALAGGSIGQGLDLADAGGLALYHTLSEMLGAMPSLDVAPLHAFADRLTRSEAADDYRTVGELLSQFLARLARVAASGQAGAGAVSEPEGRALRRLSARADAARWAALREEIDRRFARTDALNLDRKQALLGAFFAIARLAR